MKNLKVFGIASGIAADISGAQLGVWDIYYNAKHINPNFEVHKIYYHNSIATKIDALKPLSEFYKNIVSELTTNCHKDDKFLFLTGDHSGAIAVWSTISNIKNRTNLKNGDNNSKNEDIGLIWIDAHLDMHTPQTTPSGNIHGMPVSTLMGHGDSKLTSLINNKIKPENICFVGTRSYENEELELAKKLGIKIIFMTDINQNNIENTIKDAIAHVTQKTPFFGVSLDIDSMNPEEMPGTGCYNLNGLTLNSVMAFVKAASHNPKFTALEITEYNPLRDIDRKTLNGISKLIQNTFFK